MNSEFEFQQLNAFVAVAHSGNFTRAANELNTSQPTLSRLILKLEEQIGRPLFERKPRGVDLTEAGELLLARSKEILAILDDAFSELSESATKGRIRLGAIPTIAPFYLPHILRSFSELHPGVTITIIEDTTDNLVKSCNNGELDIVILALPTDVKYLTVTPLFDEELILVMQQGHELATQDEIQLEELDNYPFLMLSPAHCLSEHITSFCQLKSIAPISIQNTSQLATVQELVALGHGISMIPAMARNLDNSELRTYKSITGSPPTRTIAMLENPYRYQSHWLKVFKKHLQDQGEVGSS